jgi:hypothetical protein
MSSSSSEEDEAEAQPAAQAPCAGCRTLRRRCVPGCVFAPYFPAEGDADDPSRFAAVHRVFGASNASRLLEDVAVPEARRRAAETLVEQARARLRDPAFGCISYVAVLQELNEKARDQVDAVRREIAGEFGDEAAAEAVDVAEADPAARVEARAQAERALAHARAKNAELMAARHAADAEWWRQKRRAEKHAAGNWNTDETVVKTENTTAAAAAAAAGESSSEQTMLMLKVEDGTTEVDSSEGDGRPRQQMAETEEPAPAARKPEMLMPTAAAADQRRHLAAPHAGTEPGIPGHGQLHQKVLEDKQSSTAAAEAVREVTVAAGKRGKAPVAAPPHHDDSASTQLAGVGTSFLDGEQRAAAEALAKKLDTMIRRFTAAQQYHQDLASARYASMGADATPRLQMAGQDMMMPLLAAGASRFGSLAAQYDDDTETELGVTLVHGHQDMHQQTVQLQQMTEAQRVAAAAAGGIAREQGISTQHAAVAELAGQLAAGARQRHHPAALARYDQTEVDITLGHGQQLAGAAKFAGEQEAIIHQAAAADLAGEREMTLLLLAAEAVAQEDPVAEYSETGLGMSSLGQGHPYMHMLQEQLLSGAVGVAGVPNTTVEHQHVVAYTDGEHGNGSGATAAFRLPGLGEAAPFLGGHGIAATGADGDDGAWDPNGFIISGAAAADVLPAA